MRTMQCMGALYGDPPSFGALCQRISCSGGRTPSCDAAPRPQEFPTLALAVHGGYALAWFRRQRSRPGLLYMSIPVSKRCFHSGATNPPTTSPRSREERRVERSSRRRDHLYSHRQAGIREPDRRGCNGQVCVLGQCRPVVGLEVGYGFAVDHQCPAAQIGLVMLKRRDRCSRDQKNIVTGEE